MLMTRQPLRPYAWLTEGSAGRLMDRVAGAIARDTKAGVLLSQSRSQVMSDLKARVKSSGAVAIKAMYWSVRCPDPAAWGGLRVRTLLAGPEGIDWLDLAQDPALPALADLARQPGTWQLLRYVPLRRATLLHRPPTGPARIVKVKRPDRATDAACRLALANAARGDRPDPAMPRLLETAVNGTFALSLCPGAPIGTSPANRTPRTLMQAGRLIAALHRLPPRGLPLDPPPDPVANLDLAAALRPDLVPLLAPLVPLLRAPPAGTPAVFCHGDLGLDQILQAGATLSLVDFDRCHAGEAAADFARFLVALAECPTPNLTTDAAKAAWSVGYAKENAMPDPDRLAWFQAEALAARILVCLRKDQTAPLNRLLPLLDQQVPA